MGDRQLVTSVQLLLLAGLVLIVGCGALLFLGLAVALHYSDGSLTPLGFTAAMFFVIVLLPGVALLQIVRALGARQPLRTRRQLSIYVGPALIALGVWAIGSDPGDWFIYLPMLLLGIVVWSCGHLARIAQRQSGA